MKLGRRIKIVIFPQFHWLDENNADTSFGFRSTIWADIFPRGNEIVGYERRAHFKTPPQ